MRRIIRGISAARPHARAPTMSGAMAEPRRGHDAARSEFLDSLMDTELYSIGAYFCDEHPDLVDEVVATQRRDRGERARGVRRAERAPDSRRRSRPCSPGSRSATTRRSRAEPLGSPGAPRASACSGCSARSSRSRSAPAARSRRRSAASTTSSGSSAASSRTARSSARATRRPRSPSSTTSSAGPCADYEINTIDPLVEEYARTGDARLEFRHFSLAPNDTTLAAIAAEAAGQAGAPVAIPRHLRPQHRGDEDAGGRRAVPARGRRAPCPSSTPTSGRATSTTPAPRSWCARTRCLLPS